jgi:hypothetical protein
MSSRIAAVIAGLVLLGIAGIKAAEPEQHPGAAAMAAGRQFMRLSTEPTGILIPLYIYPANIHTNAAYNRLIELKLEHPTVPVCAIVNPASGPGAERDANYVKAIDRLHGAGIVVIGYVSTEYARRPRADVERDIARWGELYPKINGLFLDEMTNDVEGAGAEHIAHYAALTQFGHEAGYWPVIANPGTATPGAYFDAPAADVIVIHEGNSFPDEATLKGDYFGGNADYPPFTRAGLVHSRETWDDERFATLSKYVRWVYVTDDIYTTPADNPWDSLSRHMERMFEVLEGD